MNDKRLRKRGNKNGKDVWTARVDVPADAVGKRKRTRFTFTGTAKDAQAAFARCLSEIDRGEYVARDRTTVGQYLRAFLDGSRNIFAAKTWERFDSIARLHIDPALGGVPLQKLTAVQLNKAYTKWTDAGLSGQTVLHHHRLLHRLLAQAVREGILTRNVAALANRPKVRRREMRFLTVEEIGRLNIAVDGSPFAALVALALACGARRGELAGLKWEDVDFTHATLAVRRSLEQTKVGGVAEKAPKNGKARVVQLPASAVEMLRELRRERASTAGLIPTGYVFPDPVAGGAWAPNSIGDDFRKYLKSAKVAGAGLHTLRHTYASLLLSANTHPKVVQEALGHSTIAITMDLYSHLTPSLQTDAATKLDAILRAARTNAG